MLFCIDDKDKQLVVESDRSIRDPSGTSMYTFCGITHVDEAELFRVFKRNLFKSRAFTDPVEDELTFPFNGLFLVPKLFGYFPFLDCDTETMYADAIFHLRLDNIPFRTYRSNHLRKSYWIFCDWQESIDDVLDFVESYPGDHRYSWIARHKKEMCVRAVPKYNTVPSFEDDYLVNSYTEDFKYFIKKFDDYWEHGLIPTYVTNIATLDAL